MLLSQQLNPFCDDIERCAEFYRRLGCEARFRTRPMARRPTSR